MSTISDFERDFGVIPKRSVLALGISEDDTNEEITEALGKYGRVAKIVRLKSEQAIVEFDSHEAVTHLETKFPCEIASVRDPTVKWHLDSINKITSSASQSCFPVDADPSEPAPDRVDISESSNSDPGEGESDSSDAPAMSTLPGRVSHVAPAPQSRVKPSEKSVRPKTRAVPIPSTVLDKDALNPQEVQRIVVEHVIKNEASSPSPSSKRLRSFSGRMPKPPGEVDFETWYLHVELMFQDGLPADIQRRVILESLLSPASDIVKQLGSHSSPRDYIRLLQSAYGLVDDGEEVFAKFLSTHQDAGEKASEYLQRLQALLGTAIKRGGASEANANRQLYKQFTRGCWDQTLLLTLQQKIKAEPPPDFSELLLQLRS